MPLYVALRMEVLIEILSLFKAQLGFSQYTLPGTVLLSLPFFESRHIS